MAPLAGFALIGFVAALAPAAALAAPRPATPAAAAATPRSMNPCDVALEYERTAARDDVPRQAAYDSAVAGLAANVHCTDGQMHLVNEAYLLSMRAVSEHDLKIGDWSRDLTRANALLTQCTGFPGLARTKVATDCRAQIAGNQHVAAVFSAQAAAAAATPRPAAPAATPARAASPGPAGTSPTPRPPVPLPTPPAPHGP